MKNKNEKIQSINLNKSNKKIRNYLVVLNIKYIDIQIISERSIKFILNVIEN